MKRALRLREAIFLFLLFGWAVCGPACSHRAPEPATHRLASTAMACLSVCHTATYVEVSPKGDLCRCWAPNAFQYTFEFPDTPEKVGYGRRRWDSQMRAVGACRAKGLAWGPNEDGSEVICVKPSAAADPPWRT